MLGMRKGPSKIFYDAKFSQISIRHIMPIVIAITMKCELCRYSTRQEFPSQKSANKKEICMEFETVAATAESLREILSHIHHDRSMGEQCWLVTRLR